MSQRTPQSPPAVRQRLQQDQLTQLQVQMMRERYALGVARKIHAAATGDDRAGALLQVVEHEFLLLAVVREILAVEIALGVPYEELDAHVRDSDIQW